MRHCSTWVRCIPRRFPSTPSEAASERIVRPRARGLLFAIIASTFALFACSCIPIFAALGVCFTRIGAATQKRKPRLPKGYQSVDT